MVIAGFVRGADDIWMSEPARRSHEDLILWQRAMDLAEQVYKATSGLPRTELFGLVSQMRRAGAYTPSNHVPVAQRIGYLPESPAAELRHCIDDVGRILSAVISGLRRRLG
jgi:hypothetical protein